MKQRITADQLMELTPEQQERLREWWDPERGDKALVTDDTQWKGGVTLVSSYEPEHEVVRVIFITGSGSHYKNQLTPLPSTGQLIQLLKEIDPHQLENVFRETIFPSVVVDWDGKEMELIDALWEATKEVL